ncbi:MAG: phosphoribosylaminoimidazolesuccinocarboxamide synthase [Bacteroidetes bacterium]|nr:phosphoribosylaminoimidazolesuccinocarboxamide synthase [Bacteroidota bacterium]
MDALIATNFSFKKQKDFTRGKVRDVYNINDELLVLVASDRISAFDFVLPKAIPYKGQVLSQVASFFLDITKDIVPNWKIADPDPQVTIGYKCEPIHIECVVRGYLAGHSWRLYNSGMREICGNKLPEKLRENDKLNAPIFTPTTKAKQGHDIDITKEELIEQKLIKKRDLEQIEHYSMELFNAGSKHADSRNLILADTKYEFGIYNGKIMLIDEIHTPDSSRYFYKNTYDEIQNKDQQQKQLSKEFVRKWLIENGFQGRKGELVPDMNSELITSISERYIELYENITGKTFIKRSYDKIMEKIENSVNSFIEVYYEN